MSDFALNAGYAVFLWWFSTGFVLYLNQLPMHTFRHSLTGATVVLVLALFGLAWSSPHETLGAAFISFSCGLLVYAWQELSYYMGFVTGPRKISCEKGCSGWKHFGHAFQVNLYHEAATIIGAVIVIALSWGAPNQIGMWTYLLLWIMQLSAKLNVFLGVRNLSEEFLPAHMQHLKSFLNQQPMNLLFPFSITLGTFMTIWLLQLALAAEAGSFNAAGWTFLSSLMALAVLEHWFLVIPLPATALWQWWLNLRASSLKRSSQSVGNTSPTEIG
jgi:putative photosynthetic complex assembly protein 2